MGTIIKKNISENYIDPSRIVESKEFRSLLRVKRRLQRLLLLNCYSEIEQRVISGESAIKIAKDLIERDEVKEFYSNVEQLKRDILYLRKNLPILKRAQIISREYEILNFDRIIDELKELVDLYNLQKARITMEHDIEKRLKKLVPSLNREISLAVSILQSIAALKDKVTGKYTLPSISDSFKQYNFIINNLGSNIDPRMAKRVLDVLYEIVREGDETGDSNSLNDPSNTEDNNEGS